VFRRFESNADGASLGTTGGGKTLRFVVRGDERQIDARVLKWRGVATLLGLDCHCRLERPSGR